MDYALRRDSVAARLPELGVDALLVTHLPNVRYLTGFTGSNGQVLVAPSEGVFFTDGRYTEQSRREVPDLERIIYSKDFPEVLAAAGKRVGAGEIGFEAHHVTYKTFEEISKAVSLRPVGDELGRIRWTKDADELALIARAQEITDKALENLLTTLSEGMTEREAARVLDRAMEDLGAEATAFETIAAFGENTAEPHHSPTGRPLKAGDIIKLDFGALYEGYHSDMTRTMVLGEPPQELTAIFEVVKASQEAGIAAVRAGISGGEADAAARRVIEDAGYGECFSHGLGHGVGLEIHEGPTLRSGGSDVIPAGAVVTVEPGIYVSGLGGVRIEDIVEVLDGGCKPLPSSTKELVVL
ncbi:MAG: Xaa-Pro peptidase family protein [Actinomycetota bacterium]